jgi:hypothetical protein
MYFDSQSYQGKGQKVLSLLQVHEEAPQLKECHGTSFPLTEGLSTSPHLPRYLSDRSHDLWTVYIARPLWPLLISFPLYATTVLSPKSHSSPRDKGVAQQDIPK